MPYSEPSVFVKILFVMTREEAASSGSPLGPRPVSDSNTDSRLNKPIYKPFSIPRRVDRGKAPETTVLVQSVENKQHVRCKNK